MDNDVNDSGRGRGWMVATIFLTIVLLVGLGVVLLGGRDSTPTPPVAKPSSSRSSTPAPPTTSAPSTTVGASVCGLPSGSQEIPQAGPAAKWVSIAQIFTPSSPEAFGPGTTSAAGYRSCWAHSPAGALFAAANALSQASDPKLALTVAQQMYLDGPGKAAAVAQVKASPPSTPTTAGQVAGFRVLAYTASAARVQIAVRFSNDRFAAATLDLAWSGGDWRLPLTPDGRLSGGNAAQITSLDGYLPWIPNGSD